MSLEAPVVGADELGDDFTGKPVVSSRTVFHGAIWDVAEDEIDLGAAGTVKRQYVAHPGAVGIVALRTRDGRDQVALIQQYRHPVRATEWELPAGLLDVDGEAAHLAARRELAEEIDLTADRWDLLTDLFPSPGGIGEAIRVFLARELSEVPDSDRFEREAEEADIRTVWIDLEEAVTAVLTGRVTNAIAQLGVLATAAAKARDWATLRPADAPFPAHPKNRA